jgi:hypothetical protein
MYYTFVRYHHTLPEFFSIHLSHAIDTVDIPVYPPSWKRIPTDGKIPEIEYASFIRYNKWEIWKKGRHHTTAYFNESIPDKSVRFLIREYF